MSKFKKFFGKMGIIGDDEEKKLEEEIEREQQAQEDLEQQEDGEGENSVPNFERPSGRPETSARNVVDFTSVQSARDSANGNVKLKVIVIEPKSFDDVQQIANCLREKKPVVINFEKTDDTDAHRILDFISGTTYALNGEINKIGQSVFFCAPANVNVTYTEDKKKMSDMPWMK